MGRNELRKLLHLERKKWTKKSFEELFSLSQTVTYNVSYENKKYNIEVEVAEKTNDHIHIAIALDDGSLWKSISPCASGFIMHRNGKINLF